MSRNHKDREITKISPDSAGDQHKGNVIRVIVNAEDLWALSYRPGRGKDPERYRTQHTTVQEWAFPLHVE
jgi:hypothetical protein